MKVEIPKLCPSCESTLERIKDQLFCRSSNCKDQSSKKILKYAKVMKIKGLGEKTLEKLDITSLVDLYDLEKAALLEALGDKLGSKLYNNIYSNTDKELSTYLSAFSISLVGKSIAEKIESIHSGKIEDITIEVCKKAGLGAKTTTNLINWITSEWLGMKDDIPVQYSSKVADNNPPTITVCITGKLNDYKYRKLAEESLKQHNVKVTSSVTKSTQYLVCDLVGSTSSKHVKAKNYGIPILTMNELIMEI